MPESELAEREAEAGRKERILNEYTSYVLGLHASPMLLRFLESQNHMRQAIQPILQSSRRMAIALPLMQDMSAKFGLRSRQVHFHKDEPAQAAAAILGARAFTQGPDIYFAEGEGNPDTSCGLTASPGKTRKTPKALTTKCCKKYLRAFYRSICGKNSGRTRS